MTYRLPSHVRCVNNEAGVVVADLRKGLYFSVNGVGALVWHTVVVQRGSLADAVGRILEQFNVSEEKATADVRRFISELECEGLLESCEER